MSKTRVAIPAALALVAALGAGVAHARDADVQWSVTIGSPAYGRPQPVYTVPVYRQPAPVVHQRPVYSAVRYQQPTRWDRDGDGVPNRYERRDGFRRDHDRDGDGVPSWQERNDGSGPRGSR